MVGPIQVNLTGRMAFTFVAGNASGYGCVVACYLAKLGAASIIGTSPMILKIFKTGLKKEYFNNVSVLPDGCNIEITKVSQESGTLCLVLIILS